MKPVHFVGAGPGDPELITLKGRRLLDESDIVIYTGSLVPAAMVHGIKAEIYDSSGLTLDEIIDLMAGAWKDGKKIVRLHTGDPAIYGAIQEQIDALKRLGIPFDIVPGVSSVTAAAAVLKTELTIPDISQTIIITRRKGRTSVPDREDIKALARHQATMMILLSAGMMEETVNELIDGGYPDDTPVAIIEKATWPEERIIKGRLATISGLARDAGIKKTAIIAVGKVFGDKNYGKSKLYAKDFKHGYRK
ncbi:MAG: precorrin-4 C(11)-methyltransferase [Dissulfurimicrobium sp.]|uniref:precorrin-4 C(11)-methyltransferase n=1 Tax=Dissulfurimicrobium sp. TaxID=2022436 RepID=UPI004049AC8E